MILFCLAGFAYVCVGFICNFVARLVIINKQYLTMNNLQYAFDDRSWFFKHRRLILISYIILMLAFLVLLMFYYKPFNSLPFLIIFSFLNIAFAAEKASTLRDFIKEDTMMYEAYNDGRINHVDYFCRVTKYAMVAYYIHYTIAMLTATSIAEIVYELSGENHIDLTIIIINSILGLVLYFGGSYSTRRLVCIFNIDPILYSEFSSLLLSIWNSHKDDDMKSRVDSGRLALCDFIYVSATTTLYMFAWRWFFAGYVI